MPISTTSNYTTRLESLKAEIRSARVKASLAVNSEIIHLYWRIGNEVVHQRAAQSWGSKVIEQLARDLKNEFPDMHGFSLSNLKYMARFA